MSNFHFLSASRFKWRATWWCVWVVGGRDLSLDQHKTTLFMLLIKSVNVIINTPPQRMALSVNSSSTSTEKGNNDKMKQESNLYNRNLSNNFCTTTFIPQTSLLQFSRRKERVSSSQVSLILSLVLSCTWLSLFLCSCSCFGFSWFISFNSIQLTLSTPKTTKLVVSSLQFFQQTLVVYSLTWFTELWMQSSRYLTANTV